MTTVELRTSIVTELDQMSVEMLESVQHYVKRLRRHGRPAHRSATAQGRRETAMLFVKNLSVQGGMPVPPDERGIEALEPTGTVLSNHGDRLFDVNEFNQMPSLCVGRV